MIHAVLFELDGVLLDWETSISLALMDILPDVPRELREGLPARFNAAVARTCKTQTDGPSDWRHWRLLVDPTATWKVALPELNAPAISALAVRFQELFDVTLYADVPSALLALKEELALGVIARNPAAQEIVARGGIGHYFDLVQVVPDEQGRPTNIDFQWALRSMKARAGESLYVASGERGASAATDAGLKVIWLDRGGTGAGAPSAVPALTRLDDLPTFLAKG